MLDFWGSKSGAYFQRRCMSFDFFPLIWYCVNENEKKKKNVKNEKIKILKNNNNNNKKWSGDMAKR